MKINKRILLSILLSILIFFQTFLEFKITSFATPNNTGFYTSTITLDGNSYPCYEYSNSALIPDSFQVYFVVNGRVQHAIWSDVLLVAINKKLGLAVNNNWFISLNSYMVTQLMGASAIAESFFTGGIYRVSNGNAVVGIALNDLTGLLLSEDNNADLTVPSNITNNIYNIVNNYMIDNPETPAYINFPTINYATALDNLNQSQAQGGWAFNALNEYKDNDLLCFMYSKDQNTGHFSMDGGSNYAAYIMPDYDYLVAGSNEGYNTICNTFNLSDYNNSPTLVSVQSLGTSPNINFKVYMYSNNSQIRGCNWFNAGSPTLQTGSDDSSTTFRFYQNTYNGGNLIPYSNKGYLTVYKNSNVPVQIENNLYQKNYYKSNTYNNYNVNNDNSVTINYNQRTNAGTTNENIYNQSQTETNNNITTNNYQVDNSVNDNSVTTIINNYYGDNSGGGGDDDDDDDNDDTIWKALLKAIAGFFEKIGELIATLLTGIFSIFTSILDAITSITEDFTSITSFISSFFSWLPAPITSLIVLGLGLALICAFLTWFKK